MKLHIRRYNAVAYWVWDVKDPDDVCGICQNNFDGTCSTCRTAGDGCPLLFGECSHVFHMHCIEKWLANAPQRDDGSHQELCPMCKRPWVQLVHTVKSAQSGGQSPQDEEVEMDENQR